MKDGGKRNEQRDVVKAELAAAGITSFHFETTGGGHKKVIFSVGGRSSTVFFPGTPGDNRGSLNMKCLIRRKIREATCQPRAKSSTDMLAA